MIEALSRSSISTSVGSFSQTGRTSQATRVAGSDFGSVLQGMANQGIDTLRQGEAAAIAGIAGTMPTQQVVEQVLAAERTLQTGIAVRDKLVAAWSEISRMQI